jgi:hypothetical protein
MAVTNRVGEDPPWTKATLRAQQPGRRKASVRL